MLNITSTNLPKYPAVHHRNIMAAVS